MPWLGRFWYARFQLRQHPDPDLTPEQENFTNHQLHGHLLRHHAQYRVQGHANRRLFHAIDTNHAMGLRMAIRAGANVDSSEYGWTALNWAVHVFVSRFRRGEWTSPDPDVISELVEAGADPNAGQDRGGCLRIAAYCGRKDIALMLLRAGARLPTFARHGLTWRDLAHSWYDRSYKYSKASEPRLALSYLRRVAQAGGFETYKDVRYRECVAAHLVARERRLPAEILDMTLEFLLHRGYVCVAIYNLFSPPPKHVMMERTWFKAKQGTPFSRIFTRYERRNPGFQLCYCLPGSDVFLDRASPVRSAELDDARKSDDSARSFAPEIHIEAHSALDARVAAIVSGRRRTRAGAGRAFGHAAPRRSWRLG
jgi:hypothetical protein